jgi:hypothetical protein
MADQPVKLGIDNLKKVVSGIATLANVGDAFGATTGVNRWSELLGLGDLLRQLSGIDFSKVMPEFKDLDAVERAEILALFESKLDLRDDQLEAVIEKGVSILERAAGIVEDTLALIKEAKK